MAKRLYCPTGPLRPASSHVSYPWVGSALLGLAVAPIFPQLLLVADARLHLRGSTTRWFFVGGSIGAITIPWSLGQGFEFIGPHVLMPVMMAILLANAGCYFLLLRRLESPGPRVLSEKNSLIKP
jgi:hypothetical protein